MQYKVCADCHTVIPWGKRRCPSCNTAFSTGRIWYANICQRDGTPVPLGTRLCNTCGGVVRNRSFSVWIWRIVLLVVSALLTLTLSQFHHYIATTYQPKSCAIEDVSILYHSTSRKSYYELKITYEVLGKDGQPITYGYGSMGLDHFTRRADAQAVADQYRTGSTYTCWYSSVAYPDTVLVLPHQPEYMKVIVWFFGGGALIYLTFWLWQHALVYPWHLRTRGRTTYGTVVDHERQYSKNGTSTFSIVKFQTQTNPPLFCRIRKPGFEPSLAQLPVRYDPLNPARNARAGFSGAGCTLLMLLLMEMIGVLFLIWMAFSL